MRTVVFLGPTLAVAEARIILNAVYAPPASQGDVYRAALTRPFAIGIVDGYFEHVPAVWHKEILWAISQGIHVFGASSMGALRAAELCTYGMRGVGSVYEGFASGALTSDDEVAVTHGAASNGYKVTSEALVNIRATLSAAAAARVISPTTHAALIQIAQRTFYPQRSYAGLIALAKQASLPTEELASLRNQLQQLRVDQKASDARALVRQLAQLCERSEPAAPATFLLSHTDAWQGVVDWAEAHPWSDDVAMSGHR